MTPLSDPAITPDYIIAFGLAANSGLLHPYSTIMPDNISAFGLAANRVYLHPCPANLPFYIFQQIGRAHV